MASASERPDLHGDLLEIAGNLQLYLEQERDDGVVVVEADRDAVKNLGNPLPVVVLPTEEKKSAGQQEGLSDMDRQRALDKIAREADACTRCGLHKTRTKVVPGQGALRPEIMFVGEAPGHDEDLQGLAFVGRAGQLLTKMIEAMGLRREDVFIANILKCRPPENRPPMPEEMIACLPYLKAQIAVLKPRAIVALGATAVKGLLGVETGITKLRGNWQEFEGIPTMPTFHPAYLLRNPPAKKDAWADLKEALRLIGREPPSRAGSK